MPSVLSQTHTDPLENTSGLATTPPERIPESLTILSRKSGNAKKAENEEHEKVRRK
jgi:hypothetical protein